MMLRMEVFTIIIVMAFKQALKFFGCHYFLIHIFNSPSNVQTMNELLPPALYVYSTA